MRQASRFTTSSDVPRHGDRRPESTVCVHRRGGEADFAVAEAQAVEAAVAVVVLGDRHVVEHEIVERLIGRITPCSSIGFTCGLSSRLPRSAVRPEAWARSTISGENAAAPWLARLPTSKL